MKVDTRKVKGRRKVHYNSFDELVADAERMSGTSVKALGNWDLGRTLKHLGAAMEGSISGKPFKVPFLLRVLGPIVIKRRLVKGPFPAGFQLPRSAAARLIPESASYDEGMAALRQGISRLQAETSRVAHPVAGRLTVKEWDSFHLRHAEMHMSFLIPAG